MTNEFAIAGRRIGPGHPVYIIAELSANHASDFENAVQLVHAAYEAGADAVKLQTYTADTLTIDSDKPYFQIGKGTLWSGRTLYSLYREAFTPWEWHPKLKAAANGLGMDLFSSPFDHTAVDFLEELAVPAYKIASFELVDLPLIKKAAATGKPLILSTGMATLSEIDDAVNAAHSAGNDSLALLKCSSAYPSPAEDMNLRTIPHLAAAFKLQVGLSDHTLGMAVPVAAVTLGATIVEKHLTFSRSTPGPDSAFSLEPQEFKEMVQAIRAVEKALGGIHYGLSESETSSRAFRRSLFITQDLKSGDFLTSDNLRSIRPSNGLPPKYYDQVLGRRIKADVERGTPLAWDLLL